MVSTTLTFPLLVAGPRYFSRAYTSPALGPQDPTSPVDFPTGCPSKHLGMLPTLTCSGNYFIALFSFESSVASLVFSKFPFSERVATSEAVWFFYSAALIQWTDPVSSAKVMEGPPSTIVAFALSEAYFVSPPCTPTFVQATPPGIPKVPTTGSGPIESSSDTITTVFSEDTPTPTWVLFSSALV